MCKRQVIEVHTVLETGWWDGIIIVPEGERGWFPSNYVSRISEEEAARLRESHERAEGVMLRRPSLAASIPVTVNPDRRDTLDSVSEDDLTSFSTGGDIFAELAAAAALQNQDELLPEAASVADAANDYFRSNSLASSSASSIRAPSSSPSFAKPSRPNLQRFVHAPPAHCEFHAEI